MLCTLQVNPVFTTAFKHDSERGPATSGYIRLTNFNGHAASDVQRAIIDLQVQLHTSVTARYCRFTSAFPTRPCTRYLNVLVNGWLSLFSGGVLALT